MTTPVIFALNGPRRAGKDTAAEAIVQWGASFGHAWMALPLAARMKTETLGAYGQHVDTLDMYEQIKDEPLDMFGGQSFRQAIIDYSARQQAKHGAGIWIETWRDEVSAVFDLGIASAIVLSDCRFMAELMAALAITPAVLLYRVYRTPKMQHEPGAWDGDIGSWLFPELFDVKQLALMNTGHIDDLRYLAGNTAYHFFRSIQRATASV